MTRKDSQPPKTMIEETDIQTPPDSPTRLPAPAGSVMPVPSGAHRVVLSPHEWTWTQAEQEEMAREIIRMGDAVKLAAPLLREIHRHPARNGPIQVAAAKLMTALGISQNDKDQATRGA